MTARPSRRPPRTAAIEAAPPVAPSAVAVLAFDPSSRENGAVALDQAGLLCWWEHWTAPKNGTLGERVLWIEGKVRSAIAELRPEVVALEHGFRNRHNPALEAVLQTIPAICRQAGIRYVEYPTATWRVAALGRGWGIASKTAANTMLRRLYPDLSVIPASDLDCGDAGGIAKAWWNRSGNSVMRELASHGIVMET